MDIQKIEASLRDIEKYVYFLYAVIGITIASYFVLKIPVLMVGVIALVASLSCGFLILKAAELDDQLRR